MTGANPIVASAEAVSDTHVRVTFSDGSIGTFDVTTYLGYPAFAPLADRAFFRRAHAAHGTIVWSEDIDLCPDTVWEEAVREPRHSPSAG
ncbi:MAG: hypothetical protein RL199_588 [Pseudomonadota bacterium]|jgi:hypothetical protein